MYDTKEEANQKLSNSIVLYDGKPVLIGEALGKGENLNLVFSDLRTGQLFQSPILDTKWEFRNLGERLGYYNVDNGVEGHKEACYVSRMAVRNTHSCQGLSSRNLSLTPLRGSSRLGLGKINVSYQYHYKTKGFLDMLEQIYPSYLDVTSEFSTDPWLISKAFHRQFAIRKGDRNDMVPWILEYKGKRVGYSKDLSSWNVSEDYDYIKESLEYLNLKVA